MMKKPFSEKVLELTRKIPRDKVTTYSEIARALGKPQAGRAVGNTLRRNVCPDKIPCYRVVRSDGSVGGYSSGKKEKIRRLERDGIRVRKGRVELERYLHRFGNRI
jgi:O-6-methylguanine DNA methyltransferase